MLACCMNNEIESGRWYTPDPLGGDMQNNVAATHGLMNNAGVMLNDSTTGVFQQSAGGTGESMKDPCAFRL